MSSVLTEGRTESITNAVRHTLRESMKEAVVEGIEEAEAERSRRSRTRRLAAALGLVGLGAALGYRLREGNLPEDAAQGLAESAPGVAERVEQVEGVGDVGPDESDQGGRSLPAKLAIAGTVVALSWAVRRWRGSRDRQTDVTEYASDRTEDVTREAADRVEAGGRTAADRMEEAGDAAEDVRERTKDSIEDRSGDGE